MIKGKNILAIITARASSKGVVGKNIRTVMGKPLIAWTIEAANASNYIDKLVISTDGEEIMEVARTYGCDVPFKRPDELSNDTATSVDVVIHTIQMLEQDFDYILLLQPTSPLRTAIDIDNAIVQFVSSGVSSLISVTKAKESPYAIHTIKNNTLKPLINTEKKPHRRQDGPDYYVVNGAIYLIETDVLMSEKSFLQSDTQVFIMPRSRSIDLDTEQDFQYLEYIIGLNLKENKNSNTRN